MIFIFFRRTEIGTKSGLKFPGVDWNFALVIVFSYVSFSVHFSPVFGPLFRSTSGRFRSTFGPCFGPYFGPYFGPLVVPPLGVSRVISIGRWQRISLLLASDKGFLYYGPPTTHFCIIGLWQRISLLLASDKGFLYYWLLTKDFFIIGLWQRISLLLASDNGFLYHWRLTKDFFSIGLWQRISLLSASDKGFLYYWPLTNYQGFGPILEAIFEGVGRGVSGRFLVPISGRIDFFLGGVVVGSAQEDQQAEPDQWGDVSFLLGLLTQTCCAQAMGGGRGGTLMGEGVYYTILYYAMLDYTMLYYIMLKVELCLSVLCWLKGCWTLALKPSKSQF